MKRINPVVLVLIGVAASLSAAVFAQNQNQNRNQDQNQNDFGPPNQTSAHDPGVRTDAIDAGKPLPNMGAGEIQYFQDGLARFTQVDSVSGKLPGEPGKGLGPGFNSNSCGGCHAQPAVGGTSPSTSAFPDIGPNPQIAAASDASATNSIPSFITADGPVREARFPFRVSASGALTQTPDGGVHDLFTITGRSDAAGCTMAQANFDHMKEMNNIIFRIPTPTFGAGLIENIADATILANMNAHAQLKE